MCEKESMNYLPNFIESKSKELIGLESADVQSMRVVQLQSFVENVVPRNVKDGVSEELHKTFLLGEKKARIRPHKSLIKKKTLSDVPRKKRGKKRMTSIEKRKLGLLYLNKLNKTFEMFIPIHKMWREYAQQSLGIQHQIKLKENGKEVNVEVVQTKLKKLELVGSILKVTKSRCSGYIGLEGIVIQETKNTFTLINVSNEVKVIPKLHSEFSFILSNYGFTFLGSHVHQRPVDKAKQSVKKHSLWL